DRDSSLVEDPQELSVSLAPRPEQVPLGNPAVREGQFASVGGVPADLGVLRRDRESRGPGGHDDRGDLLAAVGTFTGHSGHSDQSGDIGAGIRDESLVAVDDPLAVDESRRCAGGTGIGTTAGLGEPERSQRPTAAQPRQPLSPLLLGTEPVDRHRTERHPGLQRDGHRRVHPGEFFQRDTQREIVTAHPLVLLGERQAEQPHTPHRRDEFVRERCPLVVVTDHRRHFVARELTHGVGEFALFGVQPEVDHSCSCCCGVTTANDASSPTCCPGSTYSSLTTPSTSSVMVCSIVIASTIISGAPAVICCPGSTCTARTLPGIGLFTGPPAITSPRVDNRVGCSPPATAAPSPANHRVPSESTARRYRRNTPPRCSSNQRPSALDRTAPDTGSWSSTTTTACCGVPRTRNTASASPARR